MISTCTTRQRYRRATRMDASLPRFRRPVASFTKTSSDAMPVRRPGHAHICSLNPFARRAPNPPRCPILASQPGHILRDPVTIGARTCLHLPLPLYPTSNPALGCPTPITGHPGWAPTVSMDKLSPRAIYLSQLMRYNTIVLYQDEAKRCALSILWTTKKSRGWNCRASSFPTADDPGRQ